MHYHMGLLHGEVELFHETAQLKRRCHFIEGKKHGVDTIYSSDGTVLDEGLYHMGMPTGLHTRWYKNGQIKELLTYYSATSVDKKQWDEKGHPIIGEHVEPFM